MIWQKEFTLESLNEMNKGCMVENMGIVFTEIGDDYLVASMKVSNVTSQPMGLLHGGASVALAESVASVAGNMAAQKGMICLGLDINANHIRAQALGSMVYAKAKALFIGSTTQVWAIDITNSANKLVCVVRMTLAVRHKTKSTSLKK